MPPTEVVLVEREDTVATVTLNRPEVMNALHPPALAELNAVWENFIADGDLWVAILTGAGDRAFSAGADSLELSGFAFVALDVKRTV